uniref:interleukin 17a/f3 n=1 Tax=Semicossyphus pulcher TaxID=241346 RepID=UPI0037E95410
MQPVLRLLLVLGLVMLLNATMTGTAVKLRQRTRLILDPSVQSHISSASASTIANMSLSPWTYTDSFEESRLPMRISHAQCLTSSCLSLQGGGEDAALMARPIYYQVLVLHRLPKQRPNKKGGKRAKKRYDFRLGTELIAVGCTCVRPSVTQQQEHTGDI